MVAGSHADTHRGGGASRTESSDDIPIVDLSADPASVASVIRDACVRHGFFYLTDHGVPRTVVDGMHDASRAFFALPESAKRTVLASNDANNRGWTPLGEETLDPATQTRGDTKVGGTTSEGRSVRARTNTGSPCEARTSGRTRRSWDYRRAGFANP